MRALPRTASILALAAAAFTSVPASGATLLLAAGGGGGSGYTGLPGGEGSATTTSGQSGFGPGGGAGGLNGSGGAGGTGDGGDYNGGGGGGWAGNGGNGLGAGPLSGAGGSGDGGFGFPSFAGGLGGGDSPPPSANGGYGGGGGGGWQGGGGGGGVSGGGGGDGGNFSGGGGGSFIATLTDVTRDSGSNGVDNSGGQAGADGWVDIGALVFTYTGSLQTYVIPTTESYFIEAAGAQGGGSAGSIGGYGALLSGFFELTAGTKLDIVVGGAGLTGAFGTVWGGGGGGGSFVYAGAIPELSTWAMMLLGFAVLGVAGYRKAARRLVAL